MRTLTTVAALGGAMVLASCSDGVGPGSLAFRRDITVPQFDTVLANTGMVRVEIELVPGGLVAREVEIQDADEVGEEEEIESGVTAVSGALGTLTLELGGLTVSFDANTKFEADDDASLTQADFIARIEAALAAGDTPFIEAERAAPALPQAPDDPTFLARKIELEDDDEDESEIEINVAAANLTVNDTPPPDAILRVLNLPIELRVSEGTTELESELPDEREEREFEGVVQSVDEAAGTVTLTDGTVIRIVAGTDFDDEDDDHSGPGGGDDLVLLHDDDDELGSLAAVAAAVAAGQRVEAEGKGFVETETPLVIVAVEVEFEIDD